MTEINQNLPNITFSGKIDNQKAKKEEFIQPESNLKNKNEDTIRDTGVLGRSQVKANESIDNAVNLAKNNPALLNASVDFFDKMYDQLKDNGMSDDDAYYNAAAATGEFMDIFSGKC